MTPPSFSDDDSSQSPEARPSAAQGQRSRPPGETGGHTVQGWEQPGPAARRTLSEGRAEVASTPPELEQEAQLEPSPPTVPVYLRPKTPGAPVTPGVPFNARANILTAQTAALVDSITQGLAEAIAVSLRPLVASSITQLLPMILSLGSVPDPEREDKVAADPSAPDSPDDAATES